MPDFMDEFVSSFAPAYQQGVQTGVDIYNKSKSFRMMQAQFDRDTEIKRREQEIRESEEVRRQAGFDVEMADLKFERDIEQRKGKLAMNILETEARIEKVKSAKPIEDAVKRVGIKDRVGKKLPITSNKKAMQVLNLKKEQMQTELGALIDPMRAVPEQIGAKEQAEIGLIEKRTEVLGKPKPEKDDREAVWEFAKEWIGAVVGITEKNLQELSPNQYQKWVASIVKQYRAGIRPENFKLPKITEKTPFIDKQWPLSNIEATADTTFYPFAGGGETQALTPQEQEIVQSFKSNPNLTPNWNLIKADYPDVDIERMKIAIQSR